MHRACGCISAGRFAGERDVPLHAHTGCEIICMTGGCAVIDTPSHVHHLAVGSLCIVAEGVPHNQRHHGHARTNFIVFYPTPGFNTATRTVDVGTNPLIACWIDSLCTLSQQLPAQAQELAPGVLTSILGAIQVVERHSPATLPLPLRRALDVVDGPDGLRLTTGELARRACISEGYLMALFKTCLRTRPTCYLNQRRIAAARRLLAHPYTSVRETALACGFNDPNYFARVFRSHTGCTPVAFRMSMLAALPSS